LLLTNRLISLYSYLNSQNMRKSIHGIIIVFLLNDFFSHKSFTASPPSHSSLSQVHIESYKGLRVGIDAHCWLHRGSYSCSKDLAEGVATTVYIDFFVNMLKLLIKHGVVDITGIYVWSCRVCDRCILNGFFCSPDLVYCTSHIVLYFTYNSVFHICNP
jgi:XPG N-terminal domain